MYSSFKPKCSTIFYCLFTCTFVRLFVGFFEFDTWFVLLFRFQIFLLCYTTRSNLSCFSCSLSRPLNLSISILFRMCSCYYFRPLFFFRSHFFLIFAKKNQRFYSIYFCWPTFPLGSLVSWDARTLTEIFAYLFYEHNILYICIVWVLPLVVWIWCCLLVISKANLFPSLRLRSTSLSFLISPNSTLKWKCTKFGAKLC